LIIETQLISRRCQSGDQFKYRLTSAIAATPDYIFVFLSVANHARLENSFWQKDRSKQGDF
jgi:hypothetical protein